MIAHHQLGGAGVGHGLGDLEDAELFFTPVDEVTDEDDGALRVSVGARRLVQLITELVEQTLELRRAAVDVPDDVVTLHGPIIALGYDAVTESRH